MAQCRALCEHPSLPEETKKEEKPLTGLNCPTCVKVPSPTFVLWTCIIILIPKWKYCFCREIVTRLIKTCFTQLFVNRIDVWRINVKKLNRVCRTNVLIWKRRFYGSKIVYFSIKGIKRTLSKCQWISVSERFIMVPVLTLQTEPPLVVLTIRMVSSLISTVHLRVRIKNHLSWG